MHSIRKRTTFLTATAVVLSVAVCTVIGAFSAAKLGHDRAEGALSLLCESGKSSLDHYFKSVEQSIKTVSGLIDADLSTIDEAEFNTVFADHVAATQGAFQIAVDNTAGAITYYYRIDPEISAATNELGYWYTNEKGEGFAPHEVTDISDDQFECKWFYEPKNTGQPVWLPPYVTDNLDIYVLSYNVPVYWKNVFVGVVGIEIDYKTMGEQIKDIKVLQTGYAFIIEDKNRTIIYHPEIDLLGMREEDRPPVPAEFSEHFLRGEHHIEYEFQGVRKHSYWLSLSNGMTIVVAVPLIEVNQSWLSVILQIIVSGVVLVAIFIVVTTLFSRRITRPLNDLTLAAEEINKGNYDVKLDYKRDDEIGVLTIAMSNLVEHLGTYIEELNNMAFTDPLTSIGNKGAFDARVNELQKKMENERRPEFAIAFFDCDELKTINDNYGHDKGDIYLRSACNLICRVFGKSIVYRIGGDEFAVVLEDDDYKNREILAARFKEANAEIVAFSKHPWEKVRISMGIAAFDPKVDARVEDVISHADRLMYIQKKARK